MSLMISILGAIAAIFIVVLIHELGHFLVARYFKVRVLSFSIGFGKAIWSWTSPKTNIEYRIGIFPVGGYVKMLGEQNTDSETDDPAAYANKPVFQRMAIAAAGPMANFLLAIVAFMLVYMIGITYVKPKIGQVLPQSIAAKSGFQAGDEITKVGQQSVHGWQQVLTAMIAHIGDSKPLAVVVRRDGVSAVRQLDLSDWRVEERSPDLFGTLGMVPYRPAIPPIIAKVMPDSPAAKAGLMAGDRVTQLDRHPVSHWREVAGALHKMPGKRVLITVDRAGKTRDFLLHVGKMRQGKTVVGHIGVEVLFPQLPASMLYTDQKNLFAAILPAIQRTWRLFVFNAVVLGKMLVGKISLNTLGGPISIFKIAGQASQAGWGIYCGFIAFVSVALGFLNLLPIPMLDGGHILFQLIEACRGKPLSARYQMLGIKLGLVLLLWLMVQATFNDVLRLL